MLTEWVCVCGVPTHVYAYTPADLSSDLCEELPAKRMKESPGSSVGMLFEIFS